MATSPISFAKPLTSQVGGHAGVLASEDGSLVIKAALPLEHKFYESLQRDLILGPLLPFVPKFIGTLRLEGKMDEAKSAEQGNITIVPVDDTVQKENVSHSFLKPNILDVKLGTVLYDELAPPAKVERMIDTAKNTTSYETGVRLTGFQVYDNITSQPVITPKSYGKSIKPTDLPDGIARFFPVGVPADGEIFSSTSAGLPLANLLPVLRGIREDIAEIMEIFSALELRMVGGSLLIIYEADWARAELGLEKFAHEKEDDEDEDEDEDEESEDEEGRLKHVGPPYIVKLIDFAHTRLAPGEGPDKGVLLGMDTLIRLIDGRIAQLSISSPGNK